MAVKRKKVQEKKVLRELIIKAEGILWDVKADGPIPCPLGPYDDCFGRCEWLSIGDDGIAKCQETVLGKLQPEEPKDKRRKRSFKSTPAS